ACGLLDLARSSGIAVVCSEQRPALPLERADRVVFLEGGRVLLDAARERALGWLAAERPAWAGRGETAQRRSSPRDLVCRVAGASFAYPNGRVALEHRSLELRRGEVVALVGANGSGKTTLAKLAAGLLEPRSGSVVRHGHAGYLSQDPGRYLVAERADEEVALGVGGDLERARAALAAVGLADAAARHPRDLSSGERQRLALAAVAVTEPDLLVLDEPTRGVDPERKAELARRLRREAARRATLVVTHDLVFAGSVADRIVSLDEGSQA